MPDGPMIPLSEAEALEGAVWLDCRPGAGGVDLETDLSEVGDPAVGGRHPLPSLEAWCARLGQWGIGPDTPVVVFDAKGGGMYAARCWWMLRAVGHTAVWVLQGEGAPRLGTPRGPYPARAWTWPTVDADEVERRRQDPDWAVIDARGAARWRGEVEPIDPVAGRIAGAVNLPWESTVGLDADALRARFAEIAGGRRVIASCGSGVTACHTLLSMAIAGIEPAPLYVGSFSEWCRQGRPIEP